MPVIYYKGTDRNPPIDATGVAMTSTTLGPALFAWLFLTINSTWLPYLANGEPVPGTTIAEIAKALDITPGSLEYIFSLARDPKVYAAMVIVANQFQAINLANTGVDSYPIPCPRIVDLISTLDGASS